MDESSLAVADYLLGQYDNFLQFAGEKDGATRCAQIVQLLLANHVDHDVSDPLRHPVPMTMVGYRLATNSLDRAP